MGAIASGCSSESASGDGPKADAGTDVAVEDASTSDAADAVVGADTTDGGAEPEVEECVKEASTSIYGFEAVDNRTAISYRRFDRLPNPGRPDSPNCGAVVLLEMSQGSASRIDHRMYDSRTTHVTRIGDQILVVTSKYRIPGESDPEQNILADVFTVQDRRLVRQNRTEQLFHEPLSTIEFSPVNLVANGDQIVLIGRQKLARLRLDEQGGVSVEAVADRADQIDAFETQLESQWQSLGVGEQFKPNYVPDWGRHELTDDGFLIELEHGVSTWDISAIGTSREVFQSYIPLIYNLDHATLLPPAEMWAYDPEAEILYLGEVADYPTLREESPASTEEIEVVDVSDPSSPSIIARWNVTNDFSHAIDCADSEFPAYTYGDGKLVVTFTPPDSTTRMIVLESDASSVSVDELYVTTEIGPELQNLGKIVLEERRLYATDLTFQPFSSSIRYRPLSAILGDGL